VSYSDAPKPLWDPGADQQAQIDVTELHVTQKRTRWKYQREWRLILFPRAKNETFGLYKLPRSAMARVILGWALTIEEQKEAIRWLTAGPYSGVPVQKIRAAEVR